jgi:hypothetical protein
MSWLLLSAALAAPVEIVRLDGPVRGLSLSGDDVAVAGEKAGLLVDRTSHAVTTVTGGADGVVFSPDGRIALFFGEALGAVFVETATGRSVQTIRLAGGMSAAAWTDDRRGVALATRWGVLVVDGITLSIAQKRDLGARPRALRFEKTTVHADLGDVEATFDLLDPKIERTRVEVPAASEGTCAFAEAGAVRVVACGDGAVLELAPTDSWP